MQDVEEYFDWEEILDENKRWCQHHNEYHSISEFRKTKIANKEAIECKRRRRERHKIRTIINREYCNVQHSWDQLKRGSKRRNIPILFTREKFHEMYEKAMERGMCALTGIPFSTKRLDGIRKRPYIPSPDRIDSKLPYTEENTRFVCVAVNLALSNFGDEVFNAICVGRVNSINGSRNS